MIGLYILGIFSLNTPRGHSGRWRRCVLIRISPQWQVTIPKAFRPQFGPARLAEARLERMALMLRPVLAETPTEAARMFRPEGITTEVLLAAMQIVERRRQREADGAAPDTSGSGI
jgi:hypothetical protein